MTNLPETQYAVQLVGPDELIFNNSKPVHKPGPHQILCKVESVGLCFSDLKLLKQFSKHARKTDMLSGIDLSILKEIPSYVPAEKPTVPGHEAVVRIETVGQDVENFKPGQRFLVQTDYRWLKNKTSNSSFGYNFEGALQEYVLMDERIITSPQGDSMLIPASENLSASAIALVEPWACVENAYASKERQNITPNSKMLIKADIDIKPETLINFFEKYGKPAEITWQADFAAPDGIDAKTIQETDAVFDDVIYFGNDPEKIETLFANVADKGLYNIVLCGKKLDRNIVTPIGRTHYGGIRIIGTTNSDPSESMKRIPATDEIRPANRINVIGAGGPMGVMHVIRNLCQGVEDITLYAGDVDDDRLATLTKIAAPLARKNNVTYKPYNATKTEISEKFDYTSLMAPVPALAAAAIQSSAKGGLINIFAGIPANVTGEMDLYIYIKKGLYFIGTSGSVLDDMKMVLAKVEANQLDTNVSVAAVCDLETATEGIRAVEHRLIAGKILVYPACRGIGLVKLEDMLDKMPEVAAALANGLWTKQAEQKLIAKYS